MLECPKMSPEELRAEQDFEKFYMGKLWKQGFENYSKKIIAEFPRLEKMTAIEILEETEQKQNTCELCGKVCKSQYHKEEHTGSLRCRKKQAEKKGEEYTPESMRKVHCDLCKRSVQQRRWEQHLESKGHKMKVLLKEGLNYTCPICEKTYNGPRKKRILRDHLCKKIHLKKLKHPGNREKHDAMIDLYGFKIDTDKLVSESLTAKIKVV